MKKNHKKSLMLIVISMMGFSHILYSQSIYKINNSQDNDMKLSGTSTFHDWNMDTKVLAGQAQFGFKSGSDNQLTSLKALTFSLEVLSLKGSEKGLDDNAYKALKSDQFKNIVYKLISAKIALVKDNKYLVTTIGNLIIAGVTKKVTMSTYCVVNKDGTITSTGSYKLNMTDYEVKPPTFMLGAMKTGDAITLAYTMVYKK